MVELAKLYYQFWSQFTGAAFARDEVPDGQAFPYITYEIIRPEILLSGLQSVIVWTKPAGGGLNEVNTICGQIAKSIQPIVGQQLTLTDNSGAVFLRRGNPFIQLYPQDDKTIKAAYINIEIKSYVF